VKRRKERGRRWTEMRKNKLGIEKGKWGNRGLSKLVLGQNGEGGLGNSKMEENKVKIKN
jgi:hypothetical protein